MSNDRPYHVEWNGQEFDLNNPPRNPITGEGELPSEPFNCHCWKQMIVD